MLYEFAMTPELFDSSVANTDNRYGIIMGQLLEGLVENGLLANFHKDRWSKHVEEKMEMLSPMLKDQILTYLILLDKRNRLVRHPKRIAGTPKNDHEWLDLILKSHGRIQFHAIVLSKTLMDSCGRDCNSFVEFFGSLNSEQWKNSRRKTLTVTKSVNEYRAALEPVLRYARSLRLIDPYLNAEESRYFDTISICSELRGNRGNEIPRLPGHIEIHAEKKNQKPRDKTAEYDLNLWKEKLEPLIKEHKHTFRVFLWESREGREKMHDRFILTDQCGISTPGGLDCPRYSHANSTDWSLLDQAVRNKRWDDYDPEMSPFRLIKSREF